MKKILMPTDFSVPAENAAQYALQLAKVLKADLLLCHAYRVPENAPMAAQVAWPLVDAFAIKREVKNDLDAFVEAMSGKLSEADEYVPQLTYESAEGPVCEVVAHLVKKRKIDLVVMGLAGAGALTQMVLGSNSREMIEKADFPLLLVPYEAVFKKIRRIAFATDLNKSDLMPLQSLVDFAALVNAELVIVHITSKEVKPNGKLQHKIDAFFTEVASKVNFSRIKYEYVWNIDIDNGLEWISEQRNIDMVAMSHHRHHVLSRIFSASHTQRLSRHIKIPLMVFPTRE